MEILECPLYNECIEDKCPYYDKETDDCKYYTKESK